MKHLKTFENYISEGRHGRFEIRSIEDGEEKVVGYATDPDVAEELKDQIKQDLNLDDIWVVDTYEEMTV